MNYNVLYKVIVVGNSGVGKSNLITRFTQDKFCTECRPTIGVEFGEKNVECDGTTIKGQFWDTAGQERFRSITTTYYRGAQGALIVYDITKKDSFESVNRWYTEIKAHTDPDCVCVLVGNKSDLQHMRQVGKEEASLFAKTNQMFFFETSAAESVNVNEAFKHVLKEILKRKRSQLSGGSSDSKNIAPMPSKQTSGSNTTTTTTVPPPSESIKLKENNADSPAKQPCAC